MVQQHVPRGDGLEHRVVAGQGARLERRELQVRPVDQLVHLDHPVEVDRPLDVVDRVLPQAELVQQAAHQRGRAVAGDFQSHRAQEVAADELVAQRHGQVVDLVLVELQFRAAGDTELVGAVHGHAREQFADEGRQQRGQEYEVMRPAADLPGNLDDPRQGAGGAHDRVLALAAKGIAAFQADHDVE